MSDVWKALATFSVVMFDFRAGVIEGCGSFPDVLLLAFGACYKVYRPINQADLHVGFDVIGKLSLVCVLWNL